MSERKGSAMTTREAVEYLGLSVTEVRRLVATAQLWAERDDTFGLIPKRPFILDATDVSSYAIFRAGGGRR